MKGLGKSEVLCVSDLCTKFSLAVGHEEKPEAGIFADTESGFGGKDFLTLETDFYMSHKMRGRVKLRHLVHLHTAQVRVTDHQLRRSGFGKP